MNVYYRQSEKQKQDISWNCKGYCRTMGGGMQMKQLRKPTREQRKFIQAKRLNPDNWMIERDTTEKMVLVHKHFDNKRRTIQKGD